MYKPVFLHSITILHQSLIHWQVEGLEESLAEVGSRLAEAEMQLKETQQERDALGRSLRQERAGREEDAKEHQRQVFRLAEENSLLKVRPDEDK